MIVISAFVKPHQVDHTVRSSASILSFIETTFALPSLQMLDAKTDDLTSMFDYSQLANPYTPVNTHGFTPSLLQRFRPDYNPVDR
jgi:phospholipase C